MSLLESQSAKRKYWRSLDELADRPAFRDWMEREFPAAASELPDHFSRRRWLQLMGASLALGGLAGCRWQTEEFAPFTVRPQNRVPGERQYFNSSWELAGTARPLTVTSIDGRPIKIEGNADHPASLGSTSAFDQAMILSLYDPDRSQIVLERDERDTSPRTWQEFDNAFERIAQSHRTDEGRGLAILSPPTSSLTIQRLRRRLQRQFPDAAWYEHDPLGTSNAVEGSRLAFGHPLRTHISFSDARIIACLDDDPFAAHPDSTRLVRQWADGRDPDGDHVNRLYVFESGLSLTGSNADHRVPVRSSDIARVVARLEELIFADAALNQLPKDSPLAERTLQALADDLLRHRGQSVITIGAEQPAELHARIHRLNQHLENSPATVTYSEMPPESVRSAGQLAQLVAALEKNSITTLVVLDVNAAYGSALSERFAKALSRVANSIHLGLYRDETGELCRWHLPAAHPLESWSDSRSWDGSITLAQPLIDPLFGGKTPAEVLALLTGESRSDGQSLLKATMFSADGSLLRSDADWRRAIHDGFVRDSRFLKVDVTLQPGLELSLPPATQTAAREDTLELVIRPDASVLDGRFANNSWLQETPDPITKLTWTNAAVLSPSTAQRLGVEHGQMLQLTSRGAAITLPAFILPGVADQSVQLALGYGRTAAGHVGGHASEQIDPIGIDVTPLLAADGSRIVSAADVQPLAETRSLATTQDHFAIDTVGLEAIGARVGELIRTGSLEEYRHDPKFAEHRGPHHPPLESLWEEREYRDHAWGMAIDLNRCIGCNACMLACQSENNVPVVGEDQVLAGREMHWLRVDRYFSGDPSAPEVSHQPVACHHCENAPCEQVCPVAATVHSDEGLNDMVYNRCIGTRYCANNCPYKVRRFNFFDYNESLSKPGNELTQMIINPDVTVRSRGVMEKCTYCVQRIQDTKIDAKNERRDIADGEIQTACQQACPAQAIVFGDLNDADSAVARLHTDDRAYGMLAELNVKPRTKYLARIRNPHPWLAEQHEDGHESPHHESHGTV